MLLSLRARAWVSQSIHGSCENELLHTSADRSISLLV